MRYAVLNDAGWVINVIIADAEIDGLTMVASDTAAIGDSYDGEVFSSPPLPAPAVPGVISARQARLALNAAGLRDAVESAISAAGRDTHDYWEYSTELHRDHPVLLQLASALGLTDAQIDALFIEAATL